MAQINALQKRRIYDDYLAAAPGHRELAAWCESEAERAGVSAKLVRRVIAEYRELEDLTLRQATVSESLKIAAISGATRAEAFHTLARGMKAKSKRLINKSDGTQEVVVFEDYATQVRAAVEVLKSQGAYEPEKVQVEIAGDPTKMKDDELLAEISRLAKQVIAAPAGAKGPEGPAGSTVLPSELHEDEGRAGSGESVQTVS